MSEHPLLQPPAPEQLERENALKVRLAQAEKDTVVAMAAEGTTLSELAENAAWFAEAMAQKHRHPDSRKVACKSGCTWCCTQAVALTAAESVRIARFLESNELLKAEVTARLKALDAKTRDLTPAQRGSLREPCAFLQGGSCQVYSVRPLACAEFTSYDVEDCKREQGNGYTRGGVIHEKARRLTYSAVYRGLVSGLAGAYPAADTSQLELTAAVLGFLENPALEKQWAAGADMSQYRFKEQGPP